MLVDLLHRGPEDLHVAAVPVRRHEDADHRRHDLPHQVGDRVLRVGILLDAVGEDLDAEPDVALLVARDVLHALVEAGHDPALREVALDEVLAGLREGGLDEQVVHHDRRGEVGDRAVLAQAVGDLVEVGEGLAEAPGQLGLGGGERSADALAALDDLAHEAAEEDCVASLVDLLGGEEVLLLLERGGVDVRREVVGDGVLAVEEHRVVPQRGAALEIGEGLVPVLAVLGEVELGGLPVPVLPPLVQVVVGDPVDRRGVAVLLGRRRVCHGPFPLLRSLAEQPA